MFPLKSTTFPATATALAAELNDSLRDLFGLTRDPVTILERSYPHLVSLIVSLTGAKLPERPPATPSVGTPSEPALTIDAFAVNASPISVGPASVDFQLIANHVVLHRAHDRNGQLLLLLHNATDGRVEISLAVSDLEALIAEVAEAEAGRHGVNIDGVQLKLRAMDARSLAAEVRLRAKKLFLSATIRITGQLDLDRELNARISGLDCSGQGAIASVACGLLKPHLQKLDGREFSLMSLPLGEVRLRDVRIAVDDRLSVTAEFGSTS